MKGEKRNIYVRGENLKKWDNIPKGIKSSIFNNWLKSLEIEVVEIETVEVIRKVKINGKVID